MRHAASPSDWLEDISSLLPAVSLLAKMGYEYLPPLEALELRGGRRSKFVLEGVLREQLCRLNSITTRGKQYAFSDANISHAVGLVSDSAYDALYTTSQNLYELLTMGVALEQMIEGDRKSYTLQFIDWKNPDNNVYHVSDEFEVERINSTATRRPDLVLFVNGIPLAVIEAKRPDLKDAVLQGISQHLRNHQSENIPHFFCVAQLLLSVAQNSAKYGTTATPAEHWAVWKDDDAISASAELSELVNGELPEATVDRVLSWREPWQQAQMREAWSASGRLVTNQDRTIYGLLQPKRLLELIFGFIVFDAGVKKIARYQQYFAVKATVERVKTLHDDGTRRGGVIWHTTGSGKSLTMVMLAKALALEPGIRNPKIVLVNDRIDLDKQLHRTFKNCGVEAVRASNGRELVELVSLPKAEIITTVIDKFERVADEKIKNTSPDIFVLVDESHRSQYGQIHARMRNVFPNACYIGFTGTPLLKKEKNTANTFGGIIHPYSMQRAVADKVVVPLLYEGRDSEFKNTDAIDKWFERLTADLNDEQKADLKRKFNTAEPLYEAGERMSEIAFDVAQHFKANYRGTSLKGQFATSSKRAALAYKKLLDEYGLKTAIIMSAPDTREGHTTVDEADTPELQRFWNDLLARYGTAEKYEESIITSFKHEDEPELLIVVDKLLTGFDAPRNAVLYLDKRLREHSILQAIARVNRVFEDKEYGLVIDYRGIFGEMSEALEMYAALEAEGFDLEDIEGTLTNVQEEINKLPTKHAALWAVFNTVKNKRDSEEMQLWLYQPDRRDEFYEALQAYAKILQLALASYRWQDETPANVKKRFTDDLKYFLNLRTAVRLRYSEAVDYSIYEKQIRKMVLDQLGAETVKTIIESVDIFQVDRFDEELEGIEGDAAKADVISGRIKKVITERLDEDPALYLKLSEMIDDAIKAHREKRLSDAAYLQRMRDHLETTRTSGASKAPEAVRQRPAARAYYNVLQEALAEQVSDPELLVQLAIGIETIISMHRIRDWDGNDDVKKLMLNDIDDLFHDLPRQHGIELDWAELEGPIKKIMVIAVHRERHD